MTMCHMIYKMLRLAPINIHHSISDVKDLNVEKSMTPWMILIPVCSNIPHTLLVNGLPSLKFPPALIVKFQIFLLL